MKNRYLRAAVWMLTVLMVLGCLPLLASAEATLTEVSGGTSALNAGIAPAVEDGYAGIGHSGTLSVTWTIPFHIYAYGEDGSLNYLSSGSIEEHTGDWNAFNAKSVPLRVNNHQKNIKEALSHYSNYEYISTSFGTSLSSASPVNQIRLNHGDYHWFITGWWDPEPSITYGANTVAFSDVSSYALYVFIKWTPITATINGNGVASIDESYGPTEITANGEETSLKITLPTADQVTSLATGMTVAGWKGSDGKTYALGEEVTIQQSTTFVPYMSEKLYTITFVQSSDHKGAGYKTSIYAAENSTISLPNLYAGWDVEDKTFVGWSTDMSGLTPTGQGAVFPPNTLWTTDGVNGVVINDHYTFYGIWIDESYEATFEAYYHIRFDGVESTADYVDTKESPDSNFTARDGMVGYIKTPVAIGTDREAAAVNVSPPGRQTIFERVQAEASSFMSHALYADWKDESTGDFKYRDNPDAFFNDNSVVWYSIKQNGHAGQTDSATYGEAEEHWHVHGVIVPKTNFMVTYEANGGTGAPPNTQHNEGTTVTVNLDTVPTRAGYKFLGWALEQSATKAVYYTDDSGVKHNQMTVDIHKNADITLYAVWEAMGDIAYTVKHHYDANGVDTAYDQLLKGDTDAYVTAQPVEIGGYTWNSTDERNVIGGTIAADGSLVLHLYYTRDTGALTLNKTALNGTTVDSSNNSKFDFVISGFYTAIDTNRTIYVDGVETAIAGESITVSVPANGSVEITGMPTADYTITEKGITGENKVVVDGKTYDVTGSGEAVTVTKGGSASKTITNTLSTREVKVTKVWNDNGNAYGTRPQEITITLMDGTTVTVAAHQSAESQEIRFADRPIYDASGNEITYTATEATVPGYESSASGLEITNTLKTYSLDVSKIVTGNFGDVNKEFSFTAKLLTGADAETTFTTGSFKNGTKSFSLKHGDKETLTGIPYGCKVVVTENDPSPYTVTNNSAEGAAETATIGAFGVMADDSAAVTFTNTYNVQIDTGVDLDTIPYVVMLLSIFGAGALWLIGRRRRTQD